MINEQKLDKVLTGCGLRENLLGTEYTRMAVRMYRPGMGITKELYPAIAAAAKTTPTRVERAMRHAIETGFDRCVYNDEVMAMFGNTISPDSGRPCNSEFVARVARICREGEGWL